MIPIHSIDYMVPLGKTTRVFLRTGHGHGYIDVTNEWESIAQALGGLLMKPFAPVSTMPPLSPDVVTRR